MTPSEADRPPPGSGRVRVTSPRTSASPSRRVTAASEIDAQSPIGEIFIASLLRAQLRLAVIVLVAIGVLVAGLPLLFSLFPDVGSASVLGMPLPWLLLGFVVYPLLVGIGWLYVRAAERNERDFTDVVERS